MLLTFIFDVVSMWASARSTVICNTGDELGSEIHTNKIINAGSITHKITYTKTGSNYGFKTGTKSSKRDQTTTSYAPISGSII